MSEQTPISHAKERFVCADVEGFDSLAELALDMRSSWNHAADQVWREWDPVLWDLTHNPWVVLQTVSREKLERALAEPAFRDNVDALMQARRDTAQAPAWFQHVHPQSALSCVAYFSMEFMLSEALPIYSGGLGNVAGDQLKAASDLGVPVIGVAKTAFRTATHAVPVLRGEDSTRPLYVTATGMPRHDAADIVRNMAGRHRLPDALRRADALARKVPPPVRRHALGQELRRVHDPGLGVVALGAEAQNRVARRLRRQSPVAP